MNKRRLFNKRQKKILYHLADGKCEQCGKPLPESFHADHDFPWSKGGSTEIQNGRALCPDCNYKKSNSMKSKQFQPRKWQEDCRAEFFYSNKRKFAIGAVPGAGKSKAAAWIMASLLDRGDIDIIIAVSPQGNKKQEWYEDFLQFFGIPLDPNYSSTSIWKGSKYKGAILTYQGINENMMQDIRLRCKTRKVGVIADEPHHLSASETSKWGKYFQEAFAEAKYMLFLSGTYWREDKSMIPFLDYDDQQGRYVIDYEYDYTDSLKDGNSRKVEFEFYNPNIFYQDEFNGQFYEGPLSDVSDDLINKCYRKLVTERNVDLKTVMQDALAKLHEVRTTGRQAMPNAGMIVFAPDTSVAESLRHWLHTDPDFHYVTSTVVTSEDPNASDKLEQFKRSQDKVLIAVNMVSEGIDIPRLRVGVYFSVYKTFLFFMQSIVGRLIRVTQNEYQAFQTGEMPKVNFSHAFLLKHPTLLDFSKRVESEIQQAEIEQPREPKEKKDGDGGALRSGQLDFSTLDVLGIGQKEYVTSGHHIESEHAEELDAIFANSPEIIDPNIRAYLRMNIASYVQKRAPEAVVYIDPVMDEARLSDQIKQWKHKTGGLLISRIGAEQDVFWGLSIHFNKLFGKLDIRKVDIPMSRLEEAREYAKRLFHRLEGQSDSDLRAFYNQIKPRNGKRH